MRIKKHIWLMNYAVGTVCTIAGLLNIMLGNYAFALFNCIAALINFTIISEI